MRAEPASSVLEVGPPMSPCLYSVPLTYCQLRATCNTVDVFHFDLSGVASGSQCLTYEEYERMLTQWFVFALLMTVGATSLSGLIRNGANDVDMRALGTV